IKQLESAGDQYQYLLVLQPTSPLRTAQHIDEAVKLLLEKRARGVVGVTELEHPVEWADTIPDNLSMDEFLSRIPRTTRSQNYPTRYRVNGAIYLAIIDEILSSNSLFIRHGTVAYKMEQACSVDIDTETDYWVAELLLSKRDLSKS
ncbi:uncharacterized protein METZ01_LOCUS422724, partial [marine metagenome]